MRGYHLRLRDDPIYFAIAILFVAALILCAVAVIAGVSL